MDYITHRRYKGRCFSGDVNIPALTLCDAENGTIYYQGKPICFVTSEVAHQYFSRDDDGKGIERGRLTQVIQKKLSEKDDNHQARWDKIWGAPSLLRYKRIEHEDYWLWNHDFFNANIQDLRYIASLIGAKEE